MHQYPKSARLRSSAEFRRVYQEGRKFSGPLFAAFYRRVADGAPPRVGFTTPRAIGGAVVRNRIKRRLREVVRMRLASVAAGWEVVFNPRRAAMEAEFQRLEAEVERLFATLESKS